MPRTLKGISKTIRTPVTVEFLDDEPFEFAVSWKRLDVDESKAVVEPFLKADDEADRLSDEDVCERYLVAIHDLEDPDTGEVADVPAEEFEETWREMLRYREYKTAIGASFLYSLTGRNLLDAKN